MRDHDATVSIGGSIFIQPEEVSDTIARIRQFESYIHNSRRFFIVGPNFGPYTDEFFISEFRRLFADVDDVCFRDVTSFDLFKNLPNVRMASDVVFSLQNYTLSASVDPSAKKNVVVSVIDLSRRPDLSEYTDAYERFLVDISKKYQDLGYEITLVGFCEYEGDGIAIDSLLRKYPEMKFRKCVYTGDTQEVLGLLKSSELVVSTRFHSLVLAILFERPFVSISYSNKTRNLLSDIGLSNADHPIASLVTKSDSMYDFMTASIEEKEVAQLSSNAEGQFKALDAYILND